MVINVLRLYIELTPHLAAEAFYTGEVENELREIGCIDYRFFSNGDRQPCMEMIEERRIQNLYPHPADSCSTDCQKRGIGRISYDVQDIVLFGFCYLDA